MNAAILHPDVQEYINQHLKIDSSELILKGSSIRGVSVQQLVEQIEAKGKSEKKLPTWFHENAIYYPNKLNIEQTSSELTAAYKSDLINGKTLIDLTGGFGVDAYFFAKHFDEVTHCELDETLSAIVRYNFEKLKVANINVVATDGLSYLSSSKKIYDWIYVDPSRRHDSKGKVFFLKDCLPNIPNHLQTLWMHSNNIMIKTSPLLDLTVGLKELQDVKTIHIIAVNNEVKEVLWLLECGFSGKTAIKTANLKTHNTEYFDFLLDEESNVEPDYSEPRSCLYEPNAAILKSGGFNSVVAIVGVSKLHKHSHLYTSDALIEFPGRRFKILKMVPYNKRQIRALAIDKANITTRNFPETVQNIRKIFKIKEGGELYLFFTTNVDNEKIVLVCEKAV